MSSSNGNPRPKIEPAPTPTDVEVDRVLCEIEGEVMELVRIATISNTGRHVVFFPVALARELGNLIAFKAGGIVLPDV